MRLSRKYTEDAINEGPNYTCEICIKSEFRKSVIKLNPSKYEKETFDKLASRVYEWICKSCQLFDEGEDATSRPS